MTRIGKAEISHFKTHITKFHSALHSYYFIRMYRTQIFDRILKERKVQLFLGKTVVGVRKLRKSQLNNHCKLHDEIVTDDMKEVKCLNCMDGSIHEYDECIWCTQGSAQGPFVICKA